MILLILLQLFFSSANASEADCPRKILGIENIQISQQWFADDERCFLSISPRDAYLTLVYRDYLLDNRGLFFIFNSYRPGEGFASSGARELYFFPKKTAGFHWEVKEESLIVSGWENLPLRFSLKTAQIESVGDSLAIVANEVSPQNNGGVEFLNPPALMLDSGFMFGNSPSTNPEGYSEWLNTIGQKCRLKNFLLFKHFESDSSLLPKTELDRVLKQYCPEFENTL